jgi:hypothetical protein
MQMAGRGAQKDPGTSRVAAAVMLRRGEETLLRVRAEGREVVRLSPVTSARGVRAGDRVLARTGLRASGGPGRMVLDQVTGVRADVARLESGGWVLLENIFGKVVSSA